MNFKPKELYEALRQTRLRENAEEFKEEYRNRAGVEGTISQGAQAFGLRRSRYMGKSKARLQHLATAAAINDTVGEFRIGEFLQHCSHKKWDNLKNCPTNHEEKRWDNLKNCPTEEFANSIRAAARTPRFW